MAFSVVLIIHRRSRVWHTWLRNKYSWFEETSCVKSGYFASNMNGKSRTGSFPSTCLDRAKSIYGVIDLDIDPVEIV